MSILKVANVHFDSAGTNRIDYLGDDKVRITSANGTVLDGATNDALLRITQTGTGEAFRVEDSDNPDSTPFVVTANGTVGIGKTPGANVELDVAGIGLTIRTQSTDSDSYIRNDVINGVNFISGILGNTVYLGSNSNIPIRFLNNGSERGRFDTTGNLLIGRTDSTVGLGVKLDVNGAINCSNIFVNGNVVSGGGGSVTITDQSDVTPLQYITFTTTTSGTASSINVASTKLTFNVDTGTLSSTIFNSTSDINKKTNITQITDAVTLVNSMNGVRFDWKDNGLPSLGVIAQDVEKVLPELVSDEKSVNYNGIIAVLIEAVKDLSKQVEELKSR